MRPHIICHMTVSIDGKVTGDFLKQEECAPAIEEYYVLHRQFPAEAFACGRVTMEESFTGGWYPDLTEFENIKVNREDYIANQDAERYAVAFDRKGRLGWKKDEIEDEDPGYGGAHIIEVLCEEVPDAYLAYLQKIGVSYIFAGKTEMDLEAALEKLWSNFFINDLVLEGGSEINGAFQRAGLIDEISLVQASVVAGAEGKLLFEDSILDKFILREANVLSDSALWLRYLKKNNRTSPTIKLSVVMEAVEMASDMGTYYYDLDEEEIVYLSEDSGYWCDEDKELAELMDMDWERFIELPSQREIHEYQMMEDYIEELQNEKLQSELYRAIQGRGAFRRFKDKIRYAGVEKEWYEFQNKAYREFALRWCKENNIRCEIDM